MAEDRREEARERYVTGNETLKAVAEALEISFNTVQKWCREGGWVKEREKFRKRAARKAVTRAVNKRAKELSRLLEASQSMEAALLHAAKAFESALSESPELVTDGKFRSGNLRNISEALQRQAETTMRLSGIMTAEDKARIDLLERKMEMEERKEKLEREENAGAVTIIMDERTKELAK